MKKLAIIFLLLTMLTAFVVAEDLIGLELGAELGMDNVTGANGGDAAFTFTPWVQYMNSFDALDIYARAKWWFTFDDPMYQSPEFEIEGAYNIDAGPGILSIVLWNETAMKICDGESTYGGYLEPSVKYALSGDFGTVFFQPGFGIFYDKDGQERPVTREDILVVSPYNMQVNLLESMLPAGSRVGTVDKFQGQEAPAVFFSMATSSAEDLPRNIEFLFSKNRLNVAISRAQCLAIVVASPLLAEVPCNTLEQMRLVNTFCRLCVYAVSIG